MKRWKECDVESCKGIAVWKLTLRTFNNDHSKILYPLNALGQTVIPVFFHSITKARQLRNVPSLMPMGIILGAQ